MHDGSRDSPVGCRLALVLFLVTVVVALFTVRDAYEPRLEELPEAVVGEVSYLAVEETLRDLVGDGGPRVVGSPTNIAFGNRLIRVLRASGVEAEVQEAFACGNSLDCGWVRNVVARVRGSEGGDSLLVAAHYDSVWAGSGLSDNAVNVAVAVEIARILLSGAPPRNSVVFLFSDGEETGLLGAEAFFREHPLSKGLSLAVNLEGRGASGPSVLFETGKNNRLPVSAFARSADWPVASSVFAGLYQLMPQTTDFSVFRRYGLSGLNFAYLGGISHYHSALDTLSFLSPATIRHQADNAAAVVLDLAGQPISGRQASEVAFFDLYGWRLVWWSAGLMKLLALAALGVLLWLAGLEIRRGKIGRRQGLWGLMAFPGLVFGNLGAALLLAGALWGLGRLPSPQASPWIESPAAGLIAFCLLPVAVTGWLAPKLWRRSGGSLSLWLGVWISWALIATALAFAAPTLAYPFVFPGVLAALVAIAMLGGGRKRQLEELWLVLPALLAAGLWVPILWFLYSSFGILSFPVYALAIAVVLTGVGPSIGASPPKPRRRLAVFFGSATVVAALIVGWTPDHAEGVPLPLNVVFFEDGEAKQARWLLATGGEPPKALLRLAEFGDERMPAYPWSAGRFLLPGAPAPSSGLPAPSMEVLERRTYGGGHELRVRLRSPRGASRIGLLVSRSAPLKSLSVEGRSLPLKDSGASGFRRITIHGTPPEGVLLELRFDTPEEVHGFLRDDSPGLPPGGDRFLAARPSTAAPFSDGDITVISRPVTL